jgi:TRAP-type mannitol/chloroaromatic compound transport system substrate-binding protein
METVFGLYWTGKDANFNLLSRPGCPIRTVEEAVYLESKLRDWQNKLYSKFGISYLGTLMDTSVNEQLLSTVPLNSIEDLKGKKVRSSGFGAKFYAALGATTVSLSASEVYSAFQTKNIDAGEWTSYEENTRMALQEVVKYVIDPAQHCGLIEYMPLCVNAAKWKELPQHLKDVVDAAREQTLFKASLLYIDEMKAKEKWKAMPNIEIVTWSEAEQKKAREVGLKMMAEEGNKTEMGKEYLEIYRNVLWELGYKDEAKLLGHQ